MDAQQKAFYFFLENLGGSYRPAQESSFVGAVCAALKAMRTEAWAQDHMIFEWDHDDIDSSAHSDEEPFYPLWSCRGYMRCIECPQGGSIREAIGFCRVKNHHHVVASLGGVDFGRYDDDPWDSDYKRVVEAELASEVMPLNAVDSVDAKTVAHTSSAPAPKSYT